MPIPSQIVRLFKLAALQLFAVLLLVSALFSSPLHAQVEELGATANIKLMPAIVDGKPALVGNYQITCSIQDEKTTYGFSDMKLFYSVTIGSNDGDVEVSGLSGLMIGLGGGSVHEGPLEVTGPLGGSRVRAKLSGAFCHHDQLNSKMLTVWSDDVVIPPQISVSGAFDPDKPNANPYVSLTKPIPITEVPDVPVGKRLVLVLDINAHPHGSESVVLHYENAGVHFSQVLYNIAEDYNPMKEIVTPTIVDNKVKVWAELWPTETHSNNLLFHVVADPDKPKADADPDKPKTVGNPVKPKASVNPVKPKAKITKPKKY